MVEFFQTKTISEARDLIFNSINFKYKEEKLELKEALGRRLCKDINSGENIPGFDRSTVDGFAVKAKDTFGAGESLPAYLSLEEKEIVMGRESAEKLQPGMAQYVPTGGMLPPGADAVVMIEHTEKIDSTMVEIYKPAAPLENVLTKGEDISRGEQLFSEGHVLRPQDIGALAAAGITEVNVWNRFKVGIISTGDELVVPECTPSLGQVRDINSYALYGMVKENNGEPRLYGIISDEYELLYETIFKAVSENDIVLVSGGSSVGTRDFVYKALEEIASGDMLFHGVSIKPGKPTAAAVRGSTLILGLPGHPVSTILVFDLFAAPLIKHGGYHDLDVEFSGKARLTRRIRSAAGREDFVRVRVYFDGEELNAEPVLGKSGMISTMSLADGIAWIPLENEGIDSGDYVSLKLF